MEESSELAGLARGGFHPCGDGAYFERASGAQRCVANERGTVSTGGDLVHLRDRGPMSAEVLLVVVIDLDLADVHARPSTVYDSTSPIHAEFHCGDLSKSPTPAVCEQSPEDLKVALSTLRKVDLLKIDCERAEYDIVVNCDRRSWEHVSCVLLEYHPVPGHSWEDLADHFAVSWRDANPRRPGLDIAMLVRVETEVPR